MSVKVSKSPIPLTFAAASNPRFGLALFGFDDFALLERAMISSLNELPV
jgi:hypothetical protein